MSRPGVSFEDVSIAAAVIEQAGENPTVDRVRMKTGGSSSTVLRHLNEWKALKKTQSQQEGAAPVTPVVAAAPQQERANPAERVADAVRDQVIEQVGAALVEERRRHEAEIRTLQEAHRADMAAREDVWQQRLVEAQDEIAEASQRYDEYVLTAEQELEEAAEAMKAEAEKADTKIQALTEIMETTKAMCERQTDELAQKTNEIAALRTELTKAEAALDERAKTLKSTLALAEQEKAAHIDAERRAAAAESVQDNTKRVIVDLRQTVEKLQDDVLRLEREKARLEGRAEQHPAKLEVDG